MMRSAQMQRQAYAVAGESQRGIALRGFPVLVAGKRQFVAAPTARALHGPADRSRPTPWPRAWRSTTMSSRIAERAKSCARCSIRCRVQVPSRRSPRSATRVTRSPRGRCSWMASNAGSGRGSALPSCCSSNDRRGASCSLAIRTSKLAKGSPVSAAGAGRPAGPVRREWRRSGSCCTSRVAENYAQPWWQWHDKRFLCR